MPVVDLPVEELYRYRGRNPFPADHAAYWDAAVAEVEAHDPAPVLEPVSPPAPFVEAFHLWFTGLGGARVHAKYLRPLHRGEPGPAVLLFHGYSASSGDWFDKLPWVARGFSVAALDVRGQGGLSQDRGGTAGTTLRGQIVRGLHDALQGRPERLFFRSVFQDTALLARIVMGFPEVDPDRVGATGPSQGGALTLACAALTPRLKRAAPVYPFLCDYRRVWEMDLGRTAYEELRTFFRSFDPRHEREEEIFTALGYIDVQFLAPRVRAEVLMAVGLMDEICPPSTQFAAYNRLTAFRSLAIYPDFGHETLPGWSDTAYAFLGEL